MLKHSEKYREIVWRGVMRECRPTDHGVSYAFISFSSDFVCEFAKPAIVQSQGLCDFSEISPTNFKRPNRRLNVQRFWNITNKLRACQRGCLFIRVTLVRVFFRNIIVGRPKQLTCRFRVTKVIINKLSQDAVIYSHDKIISTFYVFQKFVCRMSVRKYVFCVKIKSGRFVSLVRSVCHALCD